MRSAQLKSIEPGLPSGFLAALPEFEPAADLLPRILTAHRRRRSQRRWAWAAGLAAIGIAVLMAGGVRVASQDPLLALQDESSRLQEALRATSRQPSAGWQQTLADAATAELHMVDVELQAAYDRNADTSELESLWLRRAELLRSLLTVAQESALITRI